MVEFARLLSELSTWGGQHATPWNTGTPVPDAVRSALFSFAEFYLCAFYSTQVLLIVTPACGSGKTGRPVVVTVLGSASNTRSVSAAFPLCVSTDDRCITHHCALCAFVDAFVEASASIARHTRGCISDCLASAHTLSLSWPSHPSLECYSHSDRSDYYAGATSILGNISDIYCIRNYEVRSSLEQGPGSVCS